MKPLERDFSLIFEIDNCEKNIHIGIDKYEVDMSLIDLDWDMEHTVSLTGLVRVM